MIAMKKILFLLLTFFNLSAMAQINISTGLTGLCSLDPDWTLYQVPWTTTLGSYPVNRSSAAISYEPQPVAGSGAYWVNAAPSCSHIANPIGGYTYMRQIPIAAGTPTLSYKIRIAYDDSLTRVVIMDPSFSVFADITPLVNAAFTSTEQLSSLVNYNIPTPSAGTWTLLVTTKIFNNTGGFLLSGTADTTSPCIVTAGNTTVCPCSPPIPLVGTPPGGTFAGLPNPFTPPTLLNQTGPVVYPYTYSVMPTGCSALITAAGSITVNYQVPTILSPIGVTTLSAKLCWTPVPCNVSYKLEYRGPPYTTWCTPGLTSSNCMTLCGASGVCAIQPNTTYQVRVRAIYLPCGASSAWSPISTFTTLNDACGNGTCATILPTSVSIPPMVSWTTCASAGAYHLQVTQTTPPCNITLCIANPATTSYVLPPCFIPGNATCSARIRTKCNPGCSVTCADPWSAWSPWTSFVPKGNPNSFINAQNITVFPNPTTGIINLELNLDKEQNTRIRLLDLTGRMIKEMHTQTPIGLQHLNLDISEFTDGTYLLQVFANDKLVQITKIQKTNN